MTKKTLQLLATAAIVAGFGLSTVTANAAETATDPKYTTATVELTPGDTTTGAGGIKLLSAPDVSFSGQLNGDTQTFTGGVFTTNPDSTNKDATPGTVTVNDPGTASGWNVQVASAAFVGSDGKSSLNASEMMFGAPTVSAEDSANKGTVTAGSALSFASAGQTNQMVFHAATGEGVGTWMANYAAKDASFKVAAGNKADTYTSKLTWTLTNTPA
ncbi:WxL domain-containing protein [Levilactobacillus huananensis]|uniref:WxL domain-containing protein n=1 Tax=Levilactobacillus huananensis TaxID=2486019 RepID=UPI000F785C76|nr:WxL domain-containing protein [Levilactobacillus huananensis]